METSKIDALPCNSTSRDKVERESLCVIELGIVGTYSKKEK